MFGNVYSFKCLVGQFKSTTDEYKFFRLDLTIKIWCWNYEGCLLFWSYVHGSRKSFILISMNLILTWWVLIFAGSYWGQWKSLTSDQTFSPWSVYLSQNTDGSRITSASHQIFRVKISLDHLFSNPPPPFLTFTWVACSTVTNKRNTLILYFNIRIIYFNSKTGWRVVTGFITGLTLINFISKLLLYILYTPL